MKKNRNKNEEILYDLIKNYALELYEPDITISMLEEGYKINKIPKIIAELKVNKEKLYSSSNTTKIIINVFDIITESTFSGTFSSSMQIRIYKKNNWYDANEVENLLYSTIFNIDINEKIKKFQNQKVIGIYWKYRKVLGILLTDRIKNEDIIIKTPSIFNMINFSYERLGRECMTIKKPDLINILYILEVPIQKENFELYSVDKLHRILKIDAEINFKELNYISYWCNKSLNILCSKILEKLNGEAFTFYI